jgi:methionyl-tRNA synthetase
MLDQLGVPAGERDFVSLRDPDRYARLAASGSILPPPAPIFPRLEMPAND